MTLTLGRITPDDILDWDDTYSNRRQQERIRMRFLGSSLAERKAIRTSFLEHADESVLPLTYTDDTTREGFYRMTSARVSSEDYALNTDGYVEATATIERIGTDSSTEFESLLDNKLATNSHDLASDEVNWWHAAPVGRVAYDIGSEGSPGTITRPSEGGDIELAVGIPDVSPRWRTTPSAWYSGGCYAKTAGFYRTGVNIQNTVTDWEIGNELVKVTPGTTASASDGTIDVQWWDGSAYTTAKGFEILYATTTGISKWLATRIIRVTPELVSIELQDDANEAGGNKFTRHTLVLSIRRGALMVDANYYYTGGATTWTVQRTSAEASTDVQPTGADSVMAIRATSNDGEGNRFVLGSTATSATDTTQGGIDFASTNRLKFFISSEINGSSAQTQDQAGNQCLQFVARSNEQVRPVPR